jgi:predicted acylesterase/phospholipase RssA
MHPERVQEPNGAPPKFCDLVMKGGITSGIVYPRLISELARHYRFHSIGGTSAGAIAAAATAAAEYRRRESRVTDEKAFALIEELPHDLAHQLPDGSTRLLGLFQPDPHCATLFRILTGMLNRKNARVAALHALLSALIAYFWVVLVGIALAVAVALGLGGSGSAWFAGSLLGVIAIGALLAFCLYRAITDGLVDAGFGMCSGLKQPGHDADALTPWLHQLIQKSAGLDEGKAPLTFRGLQDAHGKPEGARHSIDLRMFTTNLHHGRPYLLPHDGTSERLFFGEKDMRAVLPSEVVDFMCRPVVRPEGEPDPIAKALKERNDEALEARKPERALHELTADNFPIVLAARMSLSFPVLLKPVRLWVYDQDAPLDYRDFRPCLFSDGGLCSNFPIHLFDGVLPTWPTFGIQLEPLLEWPSKNQEQEQTDPYRPFLPGTYDDGHGERWSNFDGALPHRGEKKDRPAQLFGFFGALLNAMQNWNDNALSRMPGVRDRVVRIRLKEDEGGLNLNMKCELVEKVAGFGTDAAAELKKRFLAGHAWDEQRLVRLSVLVRVLEQKLCGLQRAWSNQPHATDYSVLLRNGMDAAPPGFKKPLTQAERDAIEKIMLDLQALATALSGAEKTSTFTAVPAPSLRIRPSL